MEKTILIGLLSLAMLTTTVAVAEQAGEQKESPSMPRTTEPMMKGEKGGESDMGGMMRMMKMMDQCSAMMESSQGSEEPKQGQKKK